jgi:hypothetical protein
MHSPRDIILTDYSRNETILNLKRIEDEVLIEICLTSSLHTHLIVNM